MLWRAEQREAEALEAAPPSRELLAEGEGDLLPVSREVTELCLRQPPSCDHGQHCSTVHTLDSRYLLIYYVYLTWHRRDSEQ